MISTTHQETRAAGELVQAAEGRLIPAAKSMALFALASPLVLGRAIDMSILQDHGYHEWRASLRDRLSDVRPIRVAFMARLPEGGAELQSGMLLLPHRHVSGAPQHVTWLVFLKGTEPIANRVPSKLRGNEMTMMEAAAALGYAVWVPDYAGMGDAKGVQEYCVPESMAASALDGLAAARAWLSASSGEHAETGRLAILGYSQGGLAAMATLRALAERALRERTPEAPGLSLIATYSMGAPLNLMDGVPFLTEEPAVIPHPDYQLMLILGWARAYPYAIRIEDILLPCIIDTVLPLFNGRRDGEELCRLIAKAVGRKPGEVLDADLYTPEYCAAIRKAPESVPYFKAQNDARLDHWTPPSGIPIIVAATPDDDIVRFSNSESAYSWMRSANPDAQISLVRLASGNHLRAAIEGLLYAVMDIDGIEHRADAGPEASSV
jgi:pimeloyl-ACP methyl ester carboxylesterase